MLSGREETRIDFPSLPLSNALLEPQKVSLLRLDLTKEQIEITEETAPVDEDGSVQLDSMQTILLRTFSYNRDLARKKAEATALKNPQIGQMIPGKGIFAGIWTPKDRDGQSLGKKFNVFAAPEDLTDASGRTTLMTFKDTAKHMTALRKWHEHDGGDFANDTALYNALVDGSAVGKWFIPTRDLLTDNLYANKDKIGGFQTSGSGLVVWYWSCTEHHDHTSLVWATRFSDGVSGWDNKDSNRGTCRPVRVEVLAL